MPNARLISERVINWTLTDRKRGFEILINIDAATDPKRVLHLLEEAAKGRPNVASDPSPCAQVIGFAAGVTNMQLRVWATRIDEWKQVRSDVCLAVFDALAREKIAVK